MPTSIDRGGEGSESVEKYRDRPRAELGRIARARGSGAFDALHSRDFRLYLFGLMVSLAGTYMQIVAEGWLVYQLTNSALSLGLVGFVVMVPLGPWTLVAGALADRIPRKTLLGIAQVGQILPPLVLAVLSWSGLVQVWHVIAVDVVMMAMAALDNPARQALLVEVVGPEDIDSALALSAAGINVARVVGPAAAGFLIRFVGLEGAFVLNGLSFLAVLAVVALMRVPRQEKPARQATLGLNLVQGGRYLLGERSIVGLLAMMAVVSFFVLPYQTLLPVFAQDILDVGATGLGFLTASAGLGAVVGALAVAGARRLQRGILSVVLIPAVAPFAAAFAFSNTFWLSCLMLAVVSGGVVALKTLNTVLIQQRTRDELRGRVSSAVVLINGATPRLGGLVAGFLASRVGAPFALGLGAVGCGVCGLLALAIVPWMKEKE